MVARARFHFTAVGTQSIFASGPLSCFRLLGQPVCPSYAPLPSRLSVQHECPFAFTGKRVNHDAAFSLPQSMPVDIH
jgi:hypothetical protein